MIVFVNTTHDPNARRLFDDLQASGISVTDEISDASDAWLVVLSPETIPSIDWEAVRNAGKPVINVVVAPCSLPTAMPGTVLDMSQHYIAGYRELIRFLYKIITDRKLNPYRGFAAYGEVEAPLFSGRGTLTKQILDHLENGARLFALSGASGSGKTSFIRAGLVARLRGNADTWLPLTVTLDTDPLRQIAVRLMPFVTDRESLVSRLYANPGALGEVLDGIATTQGKVFLALDAFEHVFTRVSLTDRVYFLDVLYDAIQREGGNYVIGITLQSDFEGRLLEYPRWAELLHNNLFQMPALKRTDIADIVRQPTQEAGLAPADDLTDLLAGDTSRSDKAGSLVGLSLALQQMAAVRRMSRADYEALGGINGVVSQYAEAIFTRLTAIQQNAAKHILLHLIDFTDDGTPAARSLSRKQLTFSWASHSDIESTLDNLLSGQLLSRSVDFESGEHYFQLGHESLVDNWARYKVWVSEDLENLRYGSHLERLAFLWSEREYAEQSLLRGSALDEAMSWTQNPDRLPSPLLQNFVAVSSEIRRNYEAQQKTQVTRQQRSNVALITAFVVALLIIAGGAFLLVRTTGERNAVSTLQADTQNNLATATSVNHTLALQLDAAATAQADAERQIATSAAQYSQAATAQAQAESDQATAVAQAESGQADAQATIQALEDLQAPAATAVANAQFMQATLDASIKIQQTLNEFVAGQLAQSANQLMNTEPNVALHLAAEAGARLIASGAGDSNPLVGATLREALKANATFSFGDDVTQSWLLDGNNYAVIQYADKPAELWALTGEDLKVVSTFANPIEQVLPLANGKLFLVDYANEATDELWNVESGKAVAQMNGDIAPPADDKANVKIPNLVQLDNGTYFVVKYEDSQASELWEVASASRLAALGGDIESIVPLQDGYFFAGYVDKKDANGIWQTKTAQLVQIAEAVIAVPYDNGIFALRRDRAYDEIWTTNPFAKVIQVVGRVESVFHLNKTPYFLIRFNGEGGAEIWQDTSNPQKVYTFRGPIDASTTYLDGGYFFVRYQDDSPSEVWSTNPLQMTAVLNGDLITLQIASALAEEVVVFDYANNTVSDLWSLKDNKVLSQLNGNVKKITSISGDVFFTVQYEDNQPPELWSAVEGKLVMKLGDKAQLVKSITPIKDGKYLVIAYTEGPSEIWSFGDLQATLVATLPDVVAGVYPFEQGNYFAVNYVSSPAQIWRSGAAAPFVTLPTDAPNISYNTKTRRLGVVASDQRSYELNFDRILQAGDATASPTDADLLALACQQIQDNAPVNTENLAQYLGGVQPLACTIAPTVQ